MTRPDMKTPGKNADAHFDDLQTTALSLSALLFGVEVVAEYSENGAGNGFETILAMMPELKRLTAKINSGLDFANRPFASWEASAAPVSRDDTPGADQ